MEHETFLEKQVITETYDKKKFNEVVNRIIQFLCQKALYEKKPQTETNQTYLGGIAFWFNLREQNASLAFNTPPNAWNFQRILEDIEDREQSLLIQHGIPIEQ